MDFSSSFLIKPLELLLDVFQMADSVVDWLQCPGNYLADTQLVDSIMACPFLAPRIFEDFEAHRLRVGAFV